MDATSGASVALQWQKGIQVMEETQEVVQGRQNGSMEKDNDSDLSRFYL